MTPGRAGSYFNPPLDWRRPGHGAASPPGTSLLELLHEALAFGTNFVNQLGIRGELLTQSDGPRLRIRLWIVDGDLDFEVSEVGPPDSLTHLCGPRNHAAVPVDPEVVAKSDAVDHQRVAVPRRRRIALPRWIRRLGQRPAVGEDLAVGAVVLVQHHQQILRLDELEKVREPVGTQK